LIDARSDGYEYLTKLVQTAPAVAAGRFRECRIFTPACTIPAVLYP
jgi:hypothetical protein